MLSTPRWPRTEHRPPETTPPEDVSSQLAMHLALPEVVPPPPVPPHTQKAALPPSTLGKQISHAAKIPLPRRVSASLTSGSTLRARIASTLDLEATSSSESPDAFAITALALLIASSLSGRGEAKSYSKPAASSFKHSYSSWATYRSWRSTYAASTAFASRAAA
ncbi:hypothetical protein ACLOJK_022935 [Asimina triloba]